MSSSALAVRGIEILDGLAAEGFRHIAIDAIADDADGRAPGDEPKGIEILAGLAGEGLRPIAVDILCFMGGARPDHRCRDCINAFASSCKSVHRWYFVKFDED